VVIGGWTLRVASLLAIAFTPDGKLSTWGLFILFAASLAATEAAERSLVGDSAAPNLRATAYGIYHLVCGLLALPGAIIIGASWQLLGQQAAFLLAAGLTAASAAALLGLSRDRRMRGTTP
jgi:MFS-type transporter involved in bile tolerance (Atg22 family)